MSCSDEVVDIANEGAGREDDEPEGENIEERGREEMLDGD